MQPRLQLARTIVGALVFGIATVVTATNVGAAGDATTVSAPNFGYTAPSYADNSGTAQTATTAQTAQTAVNATNAQTADALASTAAIPESQVSGPACPSGDVLTNSGAGLVCVAQSSGGATATTKSGSCEDYNTNTTTTVTASIVGTTVTETTISAQNSYGFSCSDNVTGASATCSGYDGSGLYYQIDVTDSASGFSVNDVGWGGCSGAW